MFSVIQHRRYRLAFSSLFFALLTSCGSQDSEKTGVSDINIAYKATNSIASIATKSPSGQTDSGLLKSLAELYPNGQLPANRAAQASLDLSQNPPALKLTAETANAGKSQSQSQSTTNTANTPIAAQAVAADYQPVQRIQNTTLYGAYFFSIYPTEITTALATNPNWRLEGPAFWASLATGSDLYPVHRFRNKTNGSYLYSIYETERADIAANYAATFAYEGVAWYARQTPATGWSALYRFRNKTNGTYLFSAYESEKDAIVAIYPDVFALEGIAYYVRQDAPVDPVPAKLPDTGITSSQCYGVGSNVLISCTSAAAIALNPAQDGMLGLDVTEPAAADGKLGFSYSTVGAFPRTDCVKDNRTGLMWEGKPTAGIRAASNTYTNFDSTTALQKWNGSAWVAPTQAEIDAPSNSVGFKNAVNASSTPLCGFTDWRLPTADELDSLVDAGIAYPGPTIDITWFPNTAATAFWSASLNVGYDGYAWVVYFSNGGVDYYNYRLNALSVRLVRASQ